MGFPPPICEKASNWFFINEAHIPMAVDAVEFCTQSNILSILKRTHEFSGRLFIFPFNFKSREPISKTTKYFWKFDCNLILCCGLVNYIVYDDVKFISRWGFFTTINGLPLNCHCLLFIIYFRSKLYNLFSYTAFVLITQLLAPN